MGSHGHRWVRLIRRRGGADQTPLSTQVSMRSGRGTGSHPPGRGRRVGNIFPVCGEMQYTPFPADNYIVVTTEWPPIKPCYSSMRTSERWGAGFHSSLQASMSAKHQDDFSPGMRRISNTFLVGGETPHTRKGTICPAAPRI